MAILPLMEGSIACNVYENTEEISRSVIQLTKENSNYTKPKMAAQIENKFRRAEMGVVDYSSLLIKGNVGFNYPLELHCTGAPRAKPIRVELNIGPCSPGEAIVQAKKTCAACPVGTYSTKGLSCLPCPYGAECVAEKRLKMNILGKNIPK